MIHHDPGTEGSDGSEQQAFQMIGDDEVQQELHFAFSANMHRTSSTFLIGWLPPSLALTARAWRRLSPTHGKGTKSGRQSAWWRASTVTWH